MRTRSVWEGMDAVVHLRRAHLPEAGARFGTRCAGAHEERRTRNGGGAPPQRARGQTHGVRPSPTATRPSAARPSAPYSARSATTARCQCRLARKSVGRIHALTLPGATLLRPDRWGSGTCSGFKGAQGHCRLACAPTVFGGLHRSEPLWRSSLVTRGYVRSDLDCALNAGQTVDQGAGWRAPDVPGCGYLGHVADKSGIEWTEATWNPTTGCDRISAGCDNCYALTLAKRLRAMGDPKYQNDGDPRTSGPGFAVTEHPDALNLPRKWASSRVVFVNSMSDLFHARVSTAFIEQVFEVMTETPRHTYQLLTKRPQRVARLADALPWPDNVWMGVSVETSDQAWRLDALREVPAAVRFISAEPLFGTASQPRPIRDALADRWWRKRSAPSSDAGRMGPRPAGSMPEGGHPLLLQAVGWADAEGQGARTRWPSVERDSAGTKTHARLAKVDRRPRREAAHTRTVDHDSALGL